VHADGKLPKRPRDASDAQFDNGSHEYFQYTICFDVVVDFCQHLLGFGADEGCVCMAVVTVESHNCHILQVTQSTKHSKRRIIRREIKH
jgi:hypothetical protein